MSKNRYKRALNHLKNKTIDEKLEFLAELPTNHTTGLYVDVPGSEVTPDPVPGAIDSPADFNEDGDGSPGYEGKDTTGLFMEDGTIKTIEPPGDTSYILGPMSSMWYAWANYTQIGYIRQADRKMVNLGRITGELDNWDGETGFTGYGQMTVEQAVWFKNITRVNDYRAFYPGPPSSTPDQYGRYVCSITGQSKPTERQPPTNWEPGTQRGSDPTDNLSLLMKDRESDKDRSDEILRTVLNAAMLGLDIVAVLAVLFPDPISSAAGAAMLGSKLRYVAKFARAIRKFNPFKSSRKPKITYTNKPTKATYKSDPLDKVLRDINRASAASPPKGSSYTRGDNIRGPYSADKAVSRPGSGKYKSSSRNYDPKNNPSFGSRRGTRKFN